MREEILKLEELSASLEPDLVHRKKHLDQVAEYSNNFIENIEQLKAYVKEGKRGKGILQNPIRDEADTLSNILNEFELNIDSEGLNPASGGHLGYIPGGGIYHSSIADFLADITNRYAGVFFASPGAVQMENLLIRWMADLVGYPESAQGNLASGGSIANLIAIVAARDAFNIKSDDVKSSVVYMSEQVHHCIDKAIRIAGLGECIIRHIPMDDRYRIDSGQLQKLIDSDKKSGLKPWLVIASAGTTDTGAIDPLKEIGTIAKKEGLWYHVDAAYGGFFILCDEKKGFFDGIEMSDSVVMDPHKGLFLPYGIGAVIVKDVNHMIKSHHYTANYMQDAKEGATELSPADLSPELTKHFRALRMWLPLRLLGVKPFRACLSEKLLLVKYFREQLSEIPGFEIGPEPDLSVTTFRYLPGSGDANEFNKKLVDEIHKDGRVFLSSTIIEGKFTLRLAVLAFRTHLRTIDLAIEILREKISLLESIELSEHS